MPEGQYGGIKPEGYRIFKASIAACILLATGLVYLNLKDLSERPRSLAADLSATAAPPAASPARGTESLRGMLQAPQGDGGLAVGLARVMEARPLVDQVQALESLAPAEDREAYEMIGSSDEALRLRRVLRLQKLVEIDPRNVELLRKDSEVLRAHPAETRESALRGAEHLAENLEASDERKLEARIDSRTHLLSFLARLSAEDARAVTQLAAKDIEQAEHARYSANPLVAEAIRSQAQALVIAAGADAKTQRETTLRVILASNDPSRRRAYLDKLALLHPAEATELRAELKQKQTEGF